MDMSTCRSVLAQTAREAWKAKLITGSGSIVNLVILLLYSRSSTGDERLTCVLPREGAEKGVRRTYVIVDH